MGITGLGNEGTVMITHRIRGMLTCYKLNPSSRVGDAFVTLALILLPAGYVEGHVRLHRIDPDLDLQETRLDVNTEVH